MALPLIRRVEGVSGRVPMHCELSLRFDFGRTQPWIRPGRRAVMAIAGPNTVYIDGPVEVSTRDGTLLGDFAVAPGEAIEFHLVWSPPEAPFSPIDDVPRAIEETRKWWQTWADRCTYTGRYRDAVVRSLLTLKALTYTPTGGIVAAPTTSLPEQLGGVRNWDYRYCWTPRSRCWRCSTPATPRRRWRGGNGCYGRWPDVPSRCRSCTASAASGG